MTVGIVVVSHSADVAVGVREVAAQMAPTVRIVPAGGDDDGGVGTSFDRIAAALEEADSGDGVVVLYDLGSALLTTEMALELADPQAAERCRIVDAPLVEGALAAAVEAESGADLAAVEASAKAVGGSTSEAEREVPPDDDAVERVVELVNPLGLHARPAATLARMVADLGAKVSVSVRDSQPVDVRSVMSVVGLATRGGDVVRLVASGARAVSALDRVADAIRGGFGEKDAGDTTETTPPTASHAGSRPAAGAPGIAIGPLHRLDALPREVADHDGVSDPATERERLVTAIETTARELGEGNDISRAHAAMIEDPELLALAEQRLADGAAQAWWSAVHDGADRAAESPDEMVAARAIDIREAGQSVLRHLGVTLARIDESVEAAVVLADEIGPAEVPKLIELGCAGVVLSRGSSTAHATLVARGLGLSLVLHAGPVLDEVTDGTTVVLDGSTGSIEVDPSPQDLETARERARTEGEVEEELRAAAVDPVTYRGRTVPVAANIGSLAAARRAVANGADAVGLLRTELLVLDRDTYPSEDEQVEDLSAIFEVLGDRPVVVRVLDAGGDKPVRSLDIGPKHHGFLGIRGLRYLLEHPDLLHTQLRAICRAASGHRVSVMAPMVTVPDEARAFRRHVGDAVSSLRSEGIEHAEPEGVGIMIEVPAAALTVRDFAGTVDFLSVGSNDLLSYLAAAERTAPGVAHLLDRDSPALSRALDLIAEDARAIGVPLAVCGEIAGDPAHAVGLLDRGVYELSMAPTRIPLVKRQIRDLA